MDTVIKKKSVSLTGIEKKALKEYRKRFDSEVACAVAIGIDRNVLNRVMLAGSGSTDTIDKIRTALAAA